MKNEVQDFKMPNWHMEPLPFKAGSKFKTILWNCDYPPEKGKGMGGTYIHVVSVVENGGENVVTFRFYSPYKERWYFEAMTAHALSYKIRVARKVFKRDKEFFAS